MKKTLLLLCFFIGVLGLFAQSIDPAFAPRILQGSITTSIVAQADGKFIISTAAIAHTFVNNTPVRALFRMDANGVVDASFQPPQGIILALAKLAIQKDGKILAAGLFEDSSGKYVASVVRLLPSGAIDPSFQQLVRPGYTVRQIVVLPNQKILLAGYNLTPEGYPILNVNLLRPDGSPDPQFISPMYSLDTFRVSSSINALGFQSNNELIIGGANIPIGKRVQHIFRLDSLGKVDPNFNPQVNVGVRSWGMLADGTLGVFSSDGSTASVFDRNGNLLTSQSLPGSRRPIWHPFDQNSFLVLGEKSYLLTKRGPSSALSALTMDNMVNEAVLGINGQLLITGSFSHIAGVFQPGLARIDLNKNLLQADPSFGVGMYASSLIPNIHVQKDGKIIIAGSFNLVNGKRINHIARLLPDGQVDPTFNTNLAAFDRAILRVGAQSNGNLVISAVYDPTATDGKLNGLTIVDKDGFQVSTIPPPSPAGPIIGARYVSVLEIDAKDRIYTGSRRFSPNGILETDYSLSFLRSIFAVNAIPPLPKDKLYILGQHLVYNQADTTILVRALPNGARDLSFQPQIRPRAIGKNLLLLDSNSVLVYFDELDAEDVWRPFLVRLDSTGRVMESFKANIQGEIESFNHFIKELTGGKILVYGNGFESYNGRPMTQPNILIDKKGNFIADFLPELPNPVFFSAAIIDQKSYYLGGSITSPNGAVGLIKVTDLSTSTQNLKTSEAKKGKIFPNPNATETLYLELDSKIQSSTVQYQMLEMGSGKVLESGRVVNPSLQSFDLKALKQGAYVLRLLGADWEESHVFSKVK